MSQLAGRQAGCLLEPLQPQGEVFREDVGVDKLQVEAISKLHQGEITPYRM